MLKEREKAMHASASILNFCVGVELSEVRQSDFIKVYLKLVRESLIKALCEKFEDLVEYEQKGGRKDLELVLEADKYWAQYYFETVIIRKEVFGVLLFAQKLFEAACSRVSDSSFNAHHHIKQFKHN
jgi:hypothetical protein